MIFVDGIENVTNKKGEVKKIKIKVMHAMPQVIRMRN